MQALLGRCHDTLAPFTSFIERAHKSLRQVLSGTSLSCCTFSGASRAPPPLGGEGLQDAAAAEKKGALGAAWKAATSCPASEAHTAVQATASARNTARP